MKTIIWLLLILFIIGICEAEVLVIKGKNKIWIDSYDSIDSNGDFVVIKTSGTITIISQAPMPPVKKP